MKQNGYTFYKQKHQSCIAGGVGKVIEEKQGLSLFLSLHRKSVQITVYVCFQ
jgi:hypothetical protein